LKTTVSGENLTDANAAVFGIENRIERSTAESISASEKLSNTISERKRLEQEKEGTRSNLNAYMETVLVIME